MMNRGRNISRSGRLLIGLALIGLAITASVGSPHMPALAQDDSLPEPSTTLRVMHAASGGPAIDIAVDGELVETNLSYRDVTPYGSVAPGEHEFRVSIVGDESGTSDIVSTQTIESGQAYTILIISAEEGIEIKSYRVNLDRTPTEKARIRTINAAADADEIDFYGGEDRWFENVGYGDASDYKEVDWGEYDLTIRQEDADSPITSLPGTTLNWGIVYDVILLGSVTDATQETITLTTSVSPRCTLLLDLRGLPSDACLRIGNLAPAGLPLVDIYYNNVRIVERLGHGDRINYVAVPVYPYEVPIHIVRSGMGTDYSTTYRYVELRPGEAYEMFIVCASNSPWIVGGRVNLTPPPVGQARWRILQGYPEAPNVDVVIKDGPTVFEEVAYKNVTDYAVLDAGTYTIQILDHDSGELLFEQETTIEPGLVYDTVLSFRVELEASGDAATPVTVTGQNAFAVTFSSPTFPRGGVLIPGSGSEEDQVATPQPA
jgi:Domain of unknown function (DUF4397)